MNKNKDYKPLAVITWAYCWKCGKSIAMNRSNEMLKGNNIMLVISIAITIIASFAFGFVCGVYYVKENELE